ncbi:feline leukemia virus subgroup C receptor-related protein 2-like protein [Dinothrombium tinctorium]|uniref:Feline leukemia virus subgroup C receptor-related protein 2-like protein n=1 Tax=Dinothrombium tinctorium TaxID=1965070 RepID=A0A3S3NPI7_9ACAR|nr:feline leukemia virus subgroup C receptor-related protein 2-like protein [Dinothrombium tinctorium]
MLREEKLNSDHRVYKVYSRRYFILVLYCFSIVLVGFQQLQYTSIANVIVKYYNVNPVAVNWTNLSQNVCTVLFSYHIGKLIEKIGLRKSMILFALLSTFGAAIKCFTFARNKFWLMMVGQLILSLFFTPTYSLCPLLGALWFKPKEIALVVGLTNASMTFGMALTFLLPALVFKDDSINEVKFNLVDISVILLMTEAAILLLTLFVVEERPPTSPSLAEEARINYEIPKVMDVLRNKNFILIIICYASGGASNQLLSVTLNQSILSEFVNGDIVLSISGILLLITGIPGSLIIGMISKIYPKYKRLLISIYSTVVICQILFLLSLWLHCDSLLYVSLIFFGGLNSASSILALDFLIEVSFPFTENIAFAIAFSAYALPNLILVPLMTKLMEKCAAVYANFIFLSLGIFSLISTLCVTEDLRRRQANTESTPLLS